MNVGEINVTLLLGGNYDGGVAATYALRSTRRIFPFLTPEEADGIVEGSFPKRGARKD